MPKWYKEDMFSSFSDMTPSQFEELGLLAYGIQGVKTYPSANSKSQRYTSIYNMLDVVCQMTILSIENQSDLVMKYLNGNKTGWGELHAIIVDNEHPSKRFIKMSFDEKNVEYYLCKK